MIMYLSVYIPYLFESKLQAQFEVQGFTGSGIATMSASNGKISSLNLFLTHTKTRVCLQKQLVFLVMNL